MKKALLLLAALPTFALAQETRVVTLEETVRLTLENSLQMNTQRNNILQRRNAVRTAQMSFLGAISVNANASERNGTWNYSNGISTGLGNIASPQTWMNIGNQKRSLEGALLSENTTRFSVKATAKRDFHANLQAQEQITAAKAALEISRIQLDQVRARVANGTAIPNDTANPTIAVMRAGFEVYSAEQAFQSSKLTLARTIGSDLPVQANPADTAGFKFIEIDSIALLDAVEHGPGMQQAEQSIEQSKYSLRLAKIAYLPRLNWNVSFSRSGSGTGLFGYNDDPFRYTSQNNWKNFGLSMTLFDNFGRENSLQQARIALDNQELTRRDTQRQLRLQLLQSITTLRTSQFQIEMQMRTITVSETNLETVTTRYNQGLVQTFDLIQAQEQLANAKRSLINLRNTYRNNVATLEQLIGRDLQ